MNSPDAGAPIGSLRPPYWIGTVALGLALTVPSWFTRDLWNPDEPRYAEVAREMVVLGDWLVPHLNGDLYAEKPPLIFWLAAVLQTLGAGVRAGRVVTGGFAVGTLLLTLALARLWLPLRSAFTAVLVLATSFEFLWIARVGVLDVPLAFFTTLAVYAFCRHRRDGGRWIVLFYAAMGLAVLTKGPVGVLTPILGAAAITISADGWRGLRARHPLWGVPLILAIVFAWVLPACLHGGPEYARMILLRQNLGRMVSSWSHPQPLHYYLTSLPAHFFPWILFVPAAFVRAWRSERGDGTGVGRWPVVWFCLGLIAFSLISGKRGRYLVPLFTALAISVAGWFGTMSSGSAGGGGGRWDLRLLRILHVVFLVLAAAPAVLIAAGGRIAARIRPAEPDVAAALADLLSPPAVFGLVLFAIVLAAAGLAGLVQSARGRPRPALHLAVAAMVCVSLGFDFVLAPALDRFKSPREVALAANALIPPGEGEIALYPDGFSGAYNIYSGRVRMPVLTTPTEVDQFLSASGARLIITTEGYYRRDAGRFTAPHRLVPAERVGHRKIVFLVPPGLAGEASAGEQRPHPETGFPS